MVTFDTSPLSPAMLGRLNKHLDKLVRVDGEVMTFRALYTSGRYSAKRAGESWVWGRQAPQWSHNLVYADDVDTSTEVPKLVFDTITLPDVSERVA